MGQVQVILLQKVNKLGNIGDVVGVKSGYARNFLLSKKIALRATKENMEHFESKRTHYEELNRNRKFEADSQSSVISGKVITLIRQASSNGILYGSVTSRDIADSLIKEGLKLNASQVLLSKPIKTLGIFECRVALHPEVTVLITINIAQSDDEAAAQIKKETVSTSTVVSKEETIN